MSAPAGWRIVCGNDRHRTAKYDTLQWAVDDAKQLDVIFDCGPHTVKDIDTHATPTTRETNT